MGMQYSFALVFASRVKPSEVVQYLNHTTQRKPPIKLRRVLRYLMQLFDCD